MVRLIVEERGILYYWTLKFAKKNSKTFRDRYKQGNCYLKN